MEGDLSTQLGRHGYFFHGKNNSWSHQFFSHETLAFDLHHSKYDPTGSQIAPRFVMRLRSALELKTTTRSTTGEVVATKAVI